MEDKFTLVFSVSQVFPILEQQSTGGEQRLRWGSALNSNYCFGA